MKPHSMEEKISYRLFLMGFLGLLFTAALCIFVFHRAFTAQAWDDLEKESDLIRAGYDLTSEPQQLSFFVTGDLRITLISPDGDVIFESATDQPMENHLTRPEIVQALQGSIGKDIRDSQTMGYETYYYAMQLPGGNILRVAQDAETVWSVYDGALPAIVLSCVALMLAAAILSTLLTRALVQPVLNMTEDLDHIQDKVPYKELIPFAESIHADRILRENNEKMRQDFTANVSHELKTPLTSISGYAELIETGIAKPEDVPGFAQKIHGEASRMIQLVNDILQLSSLDNASETSSMPEMEVVDLLDVAKECVERQKLNARHAYITLTYLGESAPVRGNRNLLDELCQNLCDNAIRYNRPGGKVQIVTACTRDGHCSLTVTDNGIGIPRESQSSVFERFYRVDKSRSKATGGTGLGLAIVKHIALIHGARIKLESQVDVGTTITVTFPTASCFFNHPAIHRLPAAPGRRSLLGPPRRESLCAADCAPADAAGLSPAASRNVPPQGKALPTVDTVPHPAAACRRPSGSPDAGWPSASGEQLRRCTAGWLHAFLAARRFVCPVCPSAEETPLSRFLSGAAPHRSRCGRPRCQKPSLSLPVLRASKAQEAACFPRVHTAGALPPSPL